MTQPDFSEYEQRRAENHELEWRIVAMLINIRSRRCRFRICRRNQLCYGTMLPSDHQRWQVRVQKDLGLTGAACADLPMCMANATADHYAQAREIHEKLMEVRGKELSDCTPWELERLFQQQMIVQHRRAATHLTSPSQRPTSDAKHEG
jgi:hypothetical protein